MQDDIVTALTREVKEEVLENYVYERRLVEEQLKFVNEMAECTARLAEKLSRRFARVYLYLFEPDFIKEFTRLAGISEALFEGRFEKESDFRKGLRFIKARGVTSRAKFKRLFVESYRRLFEWNEKYRAAYEELISECEAVNANLKKFENAYDLLTILSFLKKLDIEQIERKHFLGDNFTPEEIASVQKALLLKPARMEHFNLVPPQNLPELNAIKKELNALADLAYTRGDDRLKKLMI
jgi:hypothetical protein